MRDSRRPASAGVTLPASKVLSSDADFAYVETRILTLGGGPVEGSIGGKSSWISDEQTVPEYPYNEQWRIQRISQEQPIDTDQQADTSWGLKLFVNPVQLQLLASRENTAAGIALDFNQPILLLPGETWWVRIDGAGMIDGSYLRPRIQLEVWRKPS